MLQLVGHPPLKPAEVAGVETLVTVDGGVLVEVEFGLGLEFDLFVLFPPVMIQKYIAMRAFEESILVPYHYLVWYQQLQVYHN